MPRKRALVIGALPASLTNFRGNLLRALADAGVDVTAMAAEGSPEEIKQINDRGVSFRAYRVRRAGMNPLQEVATWLDLRRATRELAPDVVLAYTIKPVIWGGFAARSRGASRFVALITGLGYSFEPGGLPRTALTWLVSGLYRTALRHADAVVFQNRDNLEAFVSRRIVDRERCHVVNGSGVDVVHFAAQPLPSGPPVFLCIARLLGQKGLREYAAAAAIVSQRCPEVSFRLVGPPDPSPDGIRLSEVHGWSSVAYRGEAADVRPELTGCHVYVLPSYHEGMPRTVLEAMATGRAVLTTDVPGCRETVVPGENGWLVPKGDADALAERMFWFIKNDDAWQQMGTKSRAMAEERFDVAKVNAEMLRIMGIGQ